MAENGVILEFPVWAILSLLLVGTLGYSIPEESDKTFTDRIQKPEKGNRNKNSRRFRAGVFRERGLNFNL